MSTPLYFFCVLMYVLGAALCLFLITIPALKNKCRVANKPFSWGEWWSCDWNIVIGNLVLGAMLIIGLNELIAWKPGVLDYIKWFFALAGALGTSVIQQRWGQFSKSLNSLLDVKSNISDVITGGTTTVKDTVDAGSQATGQDVSVKPKS